MQKDRHMRRQGRNLILAATLVLLGCILIALHRQHAAQRYRVRTTLLRLQYLVGLTELHFRINRHLPTEDEGLGLLLRVPPEPDLPQDPVGFLVKPELAFYRMGGYQIRPILDDPHMLIDQWGTHYRYSLSQHGFSLASAGPDRRFETADDIATSNISLHGTRGARP